MIWGTIGGLAATPLVALLAQKLRHRSKRLSPGAWIVLAAACTLAGTGAATVSPRAAGAVCAAALLAVIVAAAVDAGEQRLPDVITVGGGAATFAALTVVTVTTGTGDPWRALVGAAVFGGWILLGALVTRDGYGLGDVKLAAGIGALLAWQSWLALAVGVLIGQIAVAAVLLHARFRRQARVALGPAFTFGALAAVVLAGL